MSERARRVWIEIRKGVMAGLDLLLPSQCPGCATLVDGSGRLCVACFSQTSFLSAPLCLGCGVPFALASDATSAGRCRACVEHPPAFGRARAALRYDEQARRLILPFKHADRTELAAVLGGMMARAGGALLAEADVLVPVPLHRARLRQRRYNQAALLAAVLSRRADRPWLADGLRRVRATASLGELSAAARREMVTGAFSAEHRAPRLAGRRVLLIDDVMTSGATASACAAALLAVGVMQVDVLVAARVPDPRDV